MGHTLQANGTAGKGAEDLHGRVGSHRQILDRCGYVQPVVVVVYHVGVRSGGLLPRFGQRKLFRLDLERQIAQPRQGEILVQCQVDLLVPTTGSPAQTQDGVVNSARGEAILAQDAVKRPAGTTGALYSHTAITAAIGRPESDRLPPSAWRTRPHPYHSQSRLR